MKATNFLFFVAAARSGAVESPGRCGGDNCARQVTGTREGLAPITSRQADCFNFLITTIIPNATSTITTTLTVYVDEISFSATPALEIQTTSEAAIAIPTYASSCHNSAKYSSACSCWGITAGVTTAPVPISTVTVTTTMDYCQGL